MPAYNRMRLRDKSSSVDRDSEEPRGTATAQIRIKEAGVPQAQGSSDDATKGERRERETLSRTLVAKQKPRFVC